MAYQVILIESNQAMLNNMTAVLRQSSEFELAATYKDANAALGQSGMFRPNLFLIDVENAETLDMIPAFVDIFPDSNILGLVSQWNADAAMRVVKGGGLGCILKPFKTKDIIEAIRLYKLRGKSGLSRIISFFSPKGRAGRTTMAAVLALAIAKKSGERVALIDADLQFGDLPIFFDIEPKSTVVDAVQDVKLLTPLNLKSYFHQIKENVYLLSSPDRPEYAELVDTPSLTEVVRMSCNLCRYVLIDLPAGFNPVSIGMCKLSDTVVVMAMINNGFEIQHVKRALGVFKEQETRERKIHTVFTRVNPCTEEEKLKIEQQLGYPVSDILPNEYKMISIANSGRLSKGLPMDSLLMQNMSRIADDVISGKR
ncbi:MAG: AAA family ATPase [Selenomonadaceae bacterium]|nr:AAA family ATPase [Selenomonadaceae bacterium]